MIRVPIFRIFYSTTFSILLLLTLALLAVSPADGIYQSYTHDQRWNIIVIAGVYLVICLISMFIYATRLYTTRTTLAAIPKSRLPLQKGDLPTSVRKMVLSGIERSASIAFRVKPRDLTDEIRAKHPTADMNEKPGLSAAPTWGMLSHPDWAAPHDAETPDMHYTPVLQELPYLLEARAVSLAPAAPQGMGIELPRDLLAEGGNEPAPDPIAVTLLQRPPSMPLRSYIGRLVDLGVLESVDLADEFATSYEQARFSGGSLPDREFRILMDSFAHLLDTMREPDQKALNVMADGSDASSLAASLKIGKQRRSSEYVEDSSMAAREDATPRFSRGRLAPSRLNWVTDRNRSTSRHSQNTTGSGRAFTTPGLLPSTPFYTPYPEPLSAKTASTGSLAGSEGTTHTPPKSKRSTSKKRNLSAYSRRSSERKIASRKSSKQEGRGLGLDIQGTRSNFEPDSESTGSVKVTRSRRPSTDLDSVDGAKDEHSSVEEASVIRYDVSEAATSDAGGAEERSESVDSDGSVVRRFSKDV